MSEQINLDDEAHFHLKDGQKVYNDQLPDWLACIPTHRHVEALRRMIQFAEETRIASGPIRVQVLEALMECARNVAYHSDFETFDVPAFREKIYEQVRQAVEAP